MNADPPNGKQKQPEIDALKDEINGLKNTKMQNYAINRVLKPVIEFRKSWKKSRHNEQVLQYILIIAGALVSIANVAGWMNVLPNNQPNTNVISAILGGSTSFIAISIVSMTMLLLLVKNQRKGTVDYQILKLPKLVPVTM